MDELRTNFVRLCRENGLDPQESVVAQLRRSQDLHRRGRSSRKSGTCLDLSTTSLTAQTCSVLGAVLGTDRTIVQVKLADCMIGDDGKAITSFLR